MIVRLYNYLRDVARSWGCERCERMHRRAQEAESRAARVIRQNDHTTLWRTVDYLRRRTESYRYHSAVRGWRERAYREALGARGVPDEEILRLARAADSARNARSWIGFQAAEPKGPAQGEDA